MRFDALSSANEFTAWGQCYKSCGDSALEILDDLSRFLLKDSDAKNYPDLMSFAFFCRKSNLKQIISRSVSQKDLANMRGIGTMFHITPSNIPMNFALSFLFGFLSGNTNIVKAPIGKFAQAKIFVDAWSHVSQNSEFCLHQWFCDFSRLDPELASFVAKCDGLLVWGGDQAVQSIRQLERKPESISWEFPDRYSIAILSAQSISEIQENELWRLAENFYNDTLLVDQNACSSPSLVAWIGSASEVRIARERFWSEFEKFVKSKNKIIDVATKITRSVNSAKLGMTGAGIQFGSDWYSNVVCAWVKDLSLIDLTECRPKLGFFLEAGLPDITALGKCNGILGSKLQTVSVFGLDRSSVKSVLQSVGSGERVVNVGQALAFGLVWDGKNAVYQLSKIVE